MAKRLSLSEIRSLLRNADADEASALIRSLESDERAGVQSIIAATRRRLEEEQREAARLASLYAFDEDCLSVGTQVVLGLDEVGRGPLAGPVSVGGVVLDRTHPIPGLNDSKAMSPALREEVASVVEESSLAWTVQSIVPERIDDIGIAAALREAFTAAIEAIEKQGISVDLILLDGNPLHIDSREVNVVKGDAKSASIAAASIVAKVHRDALMDAYDETYPGYGFRSHKGYGTQAHQEAIRRLGLSPIHRRSFCRGLIQETLF